MSDLGYKTHRKIIIEGLGRMNYGRPYNDEDLDINYRIQLSIEEKEFISGYEHFEAKTTDYELNPGIYELTKRNEIFPSNLQSKLMKNL